MLPTFDKITLDAFLVIVNSKRDIPWTMPHSIKKIKEQLAANSVADLKQAIKDGK